MSPPPPAASTDVEGPTDPPGGEPMDCDKSDDSPRDSIPILFDVQKAESLASERNWDELEQYILKFCAADHSHPSVTFAIYEKSIDVLNKEDKIDEAWTVFKNKVIPLEGAKDSQFWPIDLKICIDELQKCIEDSVATYPKQSLNDGLINYLQLYFPHSLSHEGRAISDRENCLYFTTTKMVNGEKKLYCLACGWPLPVGVKPVRAMLNHLTHRGKPRRCSSLTRWMAQQLSEIEELDFEFDFDSVEKYYLKKPTPPKTMLAEDLKASRIIGSASGSGKKSSAKDRKGKSGAKRHVQSDDVSKEPTESSSPSGKEQKRKTTSAASVKASRTTEAASDAGKKSARKVKSTKRHVLKDDVSKESSESSSPSGKEHKRRKTSATTVQCNPNLAHDILWQIDDMIGPILKKCASLKTEVGLRQQDLFLDMRAEICKFQKMVGRCVSQGNYVDGHAVFSMTNKLSEMMTESFLTQRSLPQEISSLIKQMSRLISKLHDSYYDDTETNPMLVLNAEEGKEDVVDSRPEPSMPGKSTAQAAEDDAVDPRPELSMPRKSTAQAAEDDAEDSATTSPKTADN